MTAAENPSPFSASALEGQPVEIFRAGDYGPKGAYTEADLDEMVNGFNPEDAPVLTLHHDDKQGPHGRVASVERRDKSLWATFANLSSEIKAWLSERPYAQRSVEIRPREANAGKLALRAVSFVSVGQVRGMAPMASFTDPLNFVIPYKEEFQMADENKGAPAPAAPPAPAGLSEDEVQAKVNAALAEQAKKFADDRAADLKRIADLEAKGRKAQFDATRAALIAEGVPPAVLNLPGLFEFTEALVPAGVITFGDKSAAPVQFFNDLLGSLKGTVPVAPAGVPAYEGPADLGADDGALLHAKATKFAEDNKVSYEAALLAVSPKRGE